MKGVRRRYGHYVVVPHFFVPRETLRRRQERDGVPYVTWEAEGFLTATEGNVVDYGAVEATIEGLAERFMVQEIAIDRWNSTGTVNRLQEAGLPVNLFGQGFASMSAAVKETERAVLAGKLQHDGHPVLRWCFANAVAVKDDAGNLKLSKSRSAEKIDGAVAGAMGIARAAASENGPSVYDDVEERPEGLLFV